MDPLHNRPAVLVVSADKAEDTYEELQRAYRPDYEEDIEEEKHQYSSLATYITEIYQENKDIRSSSGIEEKMLQSLRAYNGHYDPGDLALIKEQGGSSIFMNLTPTKCRAAMSWLRDIMMPAKENAWGLYPTTVPELPEEIRMQVQEHINTLVQEGQVEPPTDGNPQKPQALGAAQKIQEVNQLKRDIEDAFQDEIYKVALGEIKKYERIIEDQLQEGQWEKAFSDFIEDFCVFPVAVMKAPVISKRKKLSYLNGEIQESEDFVFLNQRVSPLDIYPSASATHINDGNLCEHLRFDRKTLYNFIGVKNYKEDNIRKVLELHKDGYLGGELNNTIESDKVDEEYRGDTFRASKGIIHGVHFFGSIPWSYLSDWGFSPEKIGTDEDREFEVEAILAGGEVIKCVLNEDPLLRRPYYKASWQNIPGSWWGRSLPELMRDIQRMCNATARALANNLALASGPQIEVYTDRLADDSSVDDITPFHVWQVTSDPSGAGGRAIQFWQPTSNAQELLAVYDRFELRADDATGIPRYAYGNDQTGAAAQTASGLSMLLESASKGIKDAVRNIDFGVIKPRIEYQFYWNIISDDAIDFTGDVNVVPKGSEILTMKGASEMRRNEFLQILANPTYMGIVGEEGLADILREMAKSLGLGNNIVPSRIVLKKKQEEAKAMQQQQMQMQADADNQKASTGLQATQMQVEGQMAMHQQTQQLKAEEIQAKMADKEKDRQLRFIELQERQKEAIGKQTADLQKQQMIEVNKDAQVNKQVALSLKNGDKMNQQ
jgi:hypothetical protein